RPAGVSIGAQRSIPALVGPVVGPGRCMLLSLRVVSLVKHVSGPPSCRIGLILEHAPTPPPPPPPRRGGGSHAGTGRISIRCGAPKGHAYLRSAQAIPEATARPPAAAGAGQRPAV